MPCYDPPYDDRTNSASIGIGLEARLRVIKYVKQLKDIEEFLRPYCDVYCPTPEAAAAQVIAFSVIEMIHAPWRDQI